MDLLTLQPALVAALAALAAVCCVLGVASLARRSDARARLERMAAGGPAVDVAPDDGAPAWIETVVRAAGPIARLSLPDEGWEESPLRRKFMHAGLRGRSAPTVFFAVKTLLAFGLPMAVWAVHVAGWQPGAPKLVLAMAVAGLAGLVLPNWMLDRRVERRQRELLDHFPDAIDLMTICVEAGLGLDAAIRRVADEMALKSPTLAEELQIVALEMRVGTGKDRALRNLSLRTGVEDVDTLVSTLVQSERFGTSVGESLRVHADMLRTRRRQRAEEAAAKLAVKLVFPLVMCILPSLLMVIAGPAAIQIGETFSKVGTVRAK